MSGGLGGGVGGGEWWRFGGGRGREAPFLGFF